MYKRKKGKVAIIIFLVILSFTVHWVITPKISQNRTSTLKNGPFHANMERTDGFLKEKFSSSSVELLRNPSFGSLVNTFMGHEDVLNCIAFSPDGTLLASGAWDTLIILWDVINGTKLDTLRGHTYHVTSVAFSPDGALLASASMDHTIKIWNISSRKEIRTLKGHDDTVHSVKFSPNGTMLASGGWDASVKLWDVFTGAVLQEFNEHDGPVQAVDFSPDGSLLASASHDSYIKIYNITTRERVHNFRYNGLVHTIDFSPDGTVLAAGGLDFALNAGTIKLWNVTKGTRIRTVVGHTAITWSLSYSPDSTMVASGSIDGSIRLWNSTSGEKIIDLHYGSGRAVTFSPDSTMVALGGERMVISLVNVMRGITYHTVHGKKFTEVAFSPSGKEFATADIDATIQLWNISSKTEIKTLGGHTGMITSLTFSPNGKILASGSLDASIILWNITTGDILHNLTGYVLGVTDLAFSPNGEVLASASFIEYVKLWNVTSGTVLQTILFASSNPWEGGQNGLTFSPDGTIVAVTEISTIDAPFDGKIHLWDVPNGKELPALGGIFNESEWVYSAPTAIDFSTDGTLLAAGVTDSTIILWNVSNWEVLRTFNGHSAGITSIDFSLDDSILASGSDDKTIRLWDVNTGVELVTLAEHTDTVRSVQFSPEGLVLASASMDGTIKFWEVFPIPEDIDADGMTNNWENQYNLDPTSFWDKFDDPDSDGLMNSLEFFLHCDPVSNDSDSDSIPDGWEFLNGLNFLIDDTEADDDEDGISNLYEYQTGLNPRVNDAALDKDGDGLTNLQEFQLGSGAHNIDSDFDQMPDLWEYQHGFNATNPSDASHDSDGDWIINIQEFRARSNPRDFFSVPLLSLSVIHVGIVLGILCISSATFYYYRKKLRQSLIAELKAPDYPTALKIRKAGYSNYSTFIKAQDDAKALIERAEKSYFQGEYKTAINHFEQALSIFEKLENDLIMAEVVFLVARVLKFRSDLTPDSSILQRFPKHFPSDSVINAFDQMIKALLEEIKRNWGLAEDAWLAAANIEALDIKFRIMCQGGIVDSRVKDWLNNPSDSLPTKLSTQLDELQKKSEIHHLFESLCHVFLLRARIALVTLKLEDVKECLNQCLTIAKESGLITYQMLAQKELETFLQHKQRISDILDTYSPEEQQLKLKEYISKAITTLGIERTPPET